MPPNISGTLLTKLGRKNIKYWTTFSATSAVDTAYLLNETSHRQTKMLVSMYNVSPTSYVQVLLMIFSACFMYKLQFILILPPPVVSLYLLQLSLPNADRISAVAPRTARRWGLWGGVPFHNGVGSGERHGISLYGTMWFVLKSDKSQFYWHKS